ncbi:MAG: MauE/DoxX family redox-associated membrane protein [Planctomycetota bacterium]
MLKKISDNPYLLFALRLLLALFFIYAGLSKIMAPQLFAKNIADYQILPIDLINITAITLPWLELTGGLCLVIGFKPRSAGLLVLLLMLVFDMAISSALIRGLKIRCGCFLQTTEQLVSIWSLVTNILLTISALLVFRFETLRLTGVKFIIAGKEITMKDFVARYGLPVLVGFLLGLIATSLPFGRTLNPFTQHNSQASLHLPIAPSDLTAKAVSSHQINLSWTDNSDNELGFKIERKIGEKGNYDQVAATSLPDLTSGVVSLINNTYIDTIGLQPATDYYYRVCAHNALGNSPYSNEKAVTTLPLPTAPPIPPIELKAKSAFPGIKLIWTDKSDNEEGFKIERKSVNGAYNQIGIVNADENTYLDRNNLTVSSAYCYRIKSYNTVGESSYSNEVYIIVESLAAPKNLKVSLVHDNLIVLSWTDNANTNNDRGYKIERRNDKDNVYELIATVARDTTAYLDQNVRSSTTYYYRTRTFIFNAPEESIYSDEVSVTTH